MTTSPRPPVESIDNAFVLLGNLAAVFHFSRTRSRRLRSDPLADLDWGALKAGMPFPLLDGLQENLAAAWKIVSMIHRPKPYVGTVRIGGLRGRRTWPTAVDRLLESGDEVVALLDDLRRNTPEPTDGRTRIASRRIREVLSALLTDRFRSELTNDFRPLKCRVDDRFEPTEQPKPTPEMEPPVVLRGEYESPIVLGKEQPGLTPQQRKVVKALLDAKSSQTEDQLVTSSTVSDARKVLVRLMEKSDEWAAVIHLPNGVKGAGYRIGFPTPR